MSHSPVAIVTGAGSGIGRAVAIRLASAGYALTLASRTPEALHATAALIPQGTAVHLQPTDIADPNQVHQLVDATIQQFSQLDAIANVAGFAQMQPIEATTPEMWRQTIDVNLTGPVLLTAQAWPYLKQRGGTIANVSSMASIDPFPGLSLYAAAKVGLNLFTQCTAQEGEPHNIQAVAIAPGAVETPMLRSLIDHDTLPTDQTLSPDAVAEVIVDCITRQRDFNPGETIFLTPETPENPT